MERCYFCDTELSCKLPALPQNKISRGGGEGRGGGAAGAWKVMNINRCCKQMLECSQHTYLIILGTENSSWTVHENAGVPPPTGYAQAFARHRPTRKAFSRHPDGYPTPENQAGYSGGDRVGFLNKSKKKALLTCLKGGA